MSATPLLYDPAFLVTCEHGGNRVPARYAALFDDDPELLTTHRAYDHWALDLAKRLASRLGCTLIQSTITRLLVDLNRSLSNPRVFSPYTRNLDASARTAVLDRYYHPYRCRVEEAIRTVVNVPGRVVHISVHSFSPQFDGEVRNADVGLLYDPGRESEKRLCLAWQLELSRLRRDVRVRRNYPYRGNTDGLTTYLRRRFDSGRYLGIELEVNQTWPSGNGRRWRRMQEDIIDSLMACCRRTTS